MDAPGVEKLIFICMEDSCNGKDKRAVGCSKQGEGLHQEQEHDDLVGFSSCSQ